MTFTSEYVMYSDDNGTLTDASATFTDVYLTFTDVFVIYPGDFGAQGDIFVTNQYILGATADMSVQILHIGAFPFLQSTGDGGIRLSTTCLFP